ncbi:hypothetical protein [Caedibacter taeniospiralis]|jgi:hypothetical protein|uniref:hypothetical protein n=1 Tax=Caedibacter taeniospiralis TaxID=28907 RepID=UPI0037C02E55
MTPLQDKLVKILYECDQHKKRIEYAYNNMKQKLPFDAAHYEQFPDGEIEHIDQFLFRFSKLQDVMGEKLFPTVLMLLAEDIKRKSFIDILNRLETLGLLATDSWLRLRKIRNSVAHEYGFNVVDMVESLNAIYESCADLVGIYETVHAFCLQRFDFVDR